jgi:hypothetical protein
MSKDRTKMFFDPFPMSGTYICVMRVSKVDNDLTPDDLMAIAQGTIGRYLRRKMSEARSTGGFRAGAYAVTNADKVIKSLREDSMEYLEYYNSYINSDMYGMALTR